VVGQVGAGGQKSGSSIFLSCRAVGKPLAAGGFFVSFSLVLSFCRSIKEKQKKGKP
jgi:hypothetical protein